MGFCGWLSTEQELLLRACFLKGDTALQAWQAWANRVSFTDLDHASQGLIPLLYQNLSQMQVEHHQMAKYKGLYRQNWVKGQLLFQNARQALAALQREGIQPLLFYSSGLIVACQLGYALRPTAEIDLLLPENDYMQTIGILRALGWTSKEGQSSVFRVSFHTLVHPAGHLLKIHRHSLRWGMGTQSVDFFASALPADLDGLPVQVMSPVDQYIQTCLQGFLLNSLLALRWLADLALLVRNSQTPMDWDFLSEQSRCLRASIPVTNSLLYLKNRLEIPISDSDFRLGTCIKS